MHEFELFNLRRAEQERLRTARAKTAAARAAHLEWAAACRRHKPDHSAHPPASSGKA